MESFIKQAKAVSEPTRVRMLKLLEAGELCVCEIMKILDIKQPTASKHLNILKSSGMVESRKEGTWSYYRLSRKARGDNKGFLRFLIKHLKDDALVAKDKKRLDKRSRGCKA